MSKRKFQLVNNSGAYGTGEIEYNIVVKEKDHSVTFTLSYSHSNSWQEEVRGKDILQTTDNGNNIKLVSILKKPYIGKVDGFMMEYDIFHEHLILFNFMAKYDKGLITKLDTHEIIKFK